MSMVAHWNYPTSIEVGENKLFVLPDKLKSLAATRIFMVVDPFIKQQGYFSKLLNLLDSHQIESTLFDRFQANPTEQDVAAGVQLLNKNSDEVVIALGGGSAIDVAKTIALTAKQQHALWDFEDVKNNYLRANTEKILPIIAIPTTAGTGSEVGRVAVITDSKGKVKRLIFHPQMLPCQVILDPCLTLSVPPKLTAATGMDAFAHNLEAYLAPGFHPMADGIALEGCRLIKQNLCVAFKDGQNIKARQNLLVASTMGATAFQKGLGIIHALSHPIGAMYGHHHGLLNALLMPYSLVFNREYIERKCLLLARHLDLAQPSFESLLNYIIELIKQLDLPLTLKEIGMESQAADLIAQKALADPSCQTNPKPLTFEALKQAYLDALNGVLLNVG